jgi:hypothetical protein
MLRRMGQRGIRQPRGGRRRTDHDEPGTAAEEEMLRSARGRVAILERDPVGHRLHYLRHLVEAADPEATVVTTNAAVESPEYAIHMAGLEAPCVVLTDDRGPSALLEATVDHLLGNDIRRLVLPDGDQYVVPLLRLLARRPHLPLEIRLLLMRTTDVLGPEPLRPATLAKPALVQLLRLFPQVTAMFLTDAFGVVRHRRGFPGLTGVRDPVSTEVGDLRRPKWFPPEDRAHILVGLFGAIDGRKGLPLLLEAATLGQEIVVIVGGRVAGPLHPLLTAAPARALAADGRLVVEDRLLSQDEFSSALTSVDLAAALYENDAPSGIVAQACLRGTPVLVPSGHWLGHVVSSTGAGVVTQLDAEAVVEAVRRVAAARGDIVQNTRRVAPLLGTTDFTHRMLAG